MSRWLVSQWLWCAVALATAVVGLAACRQYLPSNRYLQMRKPPPAVHSTADARGKFDHGKHAGALAKSQVSCLDCHRFDVLLDSADEAAARDLSARALYPGSAACHFCHGPSESRMRDAPQACTYCHGNLLPLMPENHKVAWLKVHASVSQANPVECENCHRNSFCIDCHERRDTIQTRVHERNFRFFHSLQARANPVQCGSCHRADYCINCHRQGEVELDR